MKDLLRRIVRDNTTLLLLLLLTLSGAFVGWQLSRLPGEEAGETGTATSATGVPVAKVIDAVAGAPLSRPQPAIERWTTANGARVLFVPAPGIPMLDVRVLFDAGSARDGAWPGLARFTAALVGEGSPGRDADAIATGFESLGAEFGVAARRDATTASLRTLSDPAIADPALALFAEVVARPTFPEDAVARTRGRLLVGLERDEERPGTLASRSFMAALYLVHPYGSPPEGTTDSVRRIGRQQLADFHARHYVARNAVIAIVGAIDRERATQVASAISDALAAGEAAPELPAPPAPAGDGFHVDFRSQQTHVLVGLPAVRRGDPDEAALALANEVLGGGGLSSLLANAVRNQRGYAYSVGSSVQAMRAQGPFVVSLQTRNEAAGDALAVTQDVLRRFAASGPTEAQLADARQQLAGSYTLGLAGNGDLVGLLGLLGFHGLPDDYIAQQLARIETLTAAEVRDAFNRHVPLDRLVTVTLGPARPVVPATVPPPPDKPALPPAAPGAPHGDAGP